MKTQVQIDNELRALSDRITEIERQMGLKTTMCAGYCNQPTTDPFGMCLACQMREKQVDAELRRRHSR
jgi:hypothetical protein